MKITDVKIYLQNNSRDIRRFNWRKGLAGPDVYGNTNHALIRIMTDEGIDGYASYSNADYVSNIAKRYFKNLLIGEDPLQKELIYHKIWEIDRLEYLPLPFFGLVDIALWDITSKKAQIPLYQLLGGYRESALAYASTATYDTLDEFMEIADQCIARGYKGIKLHAWGDARKDAELCQALRARVGKDVYLMYDGSAGFDFHDAFYLGKALEEADYYWYEEPMREYSIYAYSKLAEKLRVPLLVAETAPGSFYNSADFVHFG
jgi:L-alanine-DL-glutamate epimerase-like enolase superfamily enzyme